MVQAPYKIMQDFNAVLQDYNDYRFAVWKQEHGLAAFYACGEGKHSEPGKSNDVKRHIEGEYGDDYYELTDGTCLWIAQEGYRWNREVLDNLKDCKAIRFQKVTSMGSDAMLNFALTGKLPE